MKTIAKNVNCDICGAVVSHTTTVADGDMVCDACLNKHYKQCEHCENYFTIEQINDVGVCEECFDEHYTRCTDCGTIILNDESHIGADDRVYCERCFYEIFFHCDSCDEVEYLEDACHTRAGSICTVCAENYVYCESCGYYVHNDDAHYDEENDVYFCTMCDYKRKENKLIKSTPATPEEIEKLISSLLSSTPPIYLRLNNYNQNDDFLEAIVHKIGKVRFPIYLYGLKNRPQYGIRCSPDVFEKLSQEIAYIGGKAYQNTPIGNIGVITENGRNRLGICYNLRKYHPEYVVELIKTITDAEHYSV